IIYAGPPGRGPPFCWVRTEPPRTGPSVFHDPGRTPDAPPPPIPPPRRCRPGCPVHGRDRRSGGLERAPRPPRVGDEPRPLAGSPAAVAGDLGEPVCIPRGFRGLLQ